MATELFFFFLSSPNSRSVTFGDGCGVGRDQGREAASTTIDLNTHQDMQQRGKSGSKQSVQEEYFRNIDCYKMAIF